MFESLTNNLSEVFRRLSSKGVLSENDVKSALNDIKNILIDADTGLEPAKRFIDSIAPQTVGTKIVKSIKPSEQILALVNDGLINMLGGNKPPPPLKIDSPPAIIMMVGLQGCGKTTSSVKLAAHLKTTRNKKILLASLDPYRPAAIEQLRILANNANIQSLPPIDGQMPQDIARRTIQATKIGGYDIAILDTAGRTTLDQNLMREAQNIARITKPAEILLVADAMTGQDAVTTAAAFAKHLRLTGIILTRMDGDARGGAALSIRDVTGVPLRFTGTGEKIDDLTPFDPQRMAARILGRPDIASLTEKIAQTQNQNESKRIAERLKSGTFTLDDLIQQFNAIEKMGGLDGILGMLGGKTTAMKNSLHAYGMDPKAVHAYRAITSSMTPTERAKPKLLNASRKRRIAAGSGTQVAQINRMIKMHRTMADTIKKGGPEALTGMAGNMMRGKLPNLSRNTAK